MGKGSYGRLGLGDSTNHATPQRVRFKDETDIIKLKMVSNLINLYYNLQEEKSHCNLGFANGKFTKLKFRLLLHF